MSLRFRKDVNKKLGEMINELISQKEFPLFNIYVKNYFEVEITFLIDDIKFDNFKNLVDNYNMKIMKITDNYIEKNKEVICRLI